MYLITLSLWTVLLHRQSVVSFDLARYLWRSLIGTRVTSRSMWAMHCGVILSE